jgi:hypothetical protein
MMNVKVVLVTVGSQEGWSVGGLTTEPEYRARRIE